MTIRGAPAIGVAGAYGMVFAVKEKHPDTFNDLLQCLRDAKEYLDSARPTAVNLMWATKRVIDEVESASPSNFYEFLIELAQKIADEDVQINKQMAIHGAALVPPNSNVIHHCNTGALATVDIGTALGVIYGSVLASQ